MRFVDLVERFKCVLLVLSQNIICMSVLNGCVIVMLIKTERYTAEYSSSNPRRKEQLALSLRMSISVFSSVIFVNTKIFEGSLRGQ